MQGKLLAVDNLVVNVLVDNCIEWMSKLSPGFQHEIIQQLPVAPRDAKTGLPIMDLDNYCCGAHGLAVLITTTLGDSTQQVLFDTGPEAKSFERNILSLRIHLPSIERIVLSHWHRDHSGAIVKALEMAEEQRKAVPSAPNRKIIVDLHKDRPIMRGIAPGPKFEKVIARLPEDPTLEEIEKAGGVVELHEGQTGHVAANGTVYVSGEVPRVLEWEQGLKGGMRWFEDEKGVGTWVTEEHIMEERYAAVDVKGKGLVIFSSCSHAGICNVVRDAVNTFKRPVYMIVAGLHLAPGEFEYRIKPTVDFISRRLRPAPAFVLPLHCTGFRAKVALEQALGEGCVPAGVGMRVEVAGDESADERLWKGEIVD